MNKTPHKSPDEPLGRVMVIDDDPLTLKNLRRILEGVGHKVSTFSNPLRALKRLEEASYDLIISDIRMPDLDGFALLQQAKRIARDIEVVFITGYSSMDGAVDATKQGSYHYLAKPFTPEKIRSLVNCALREKSLREEGISQFQRDRGSQIPVMIGESPKIVRVKEVIRQIAPTECNVLITGESGTGKELVARAIHAQSNRREGPFVAFNCGAFSDELISNELFGHEREAFTGAISLKKGLLETANGGTIFLDEIADMPNSMQSKLLRVIQERELIRVGGTQPTALDVRIVTATAKDLKNTMADGVFRQDLYFRLNVVNIVLPPLTERKEDIPLLAYHILGKCNRRTKKRVTSISEESMSLFKNYAFPGNVRELENILERAVVICKGKIVQIQDLPPDLVDLELCSYNRPGKTHLSLEELEKDYISHVLKLAKGSRTRAAEILGIERTSLWRKMKKFGLK